MRESWEKIVFVYRWHDCLCRKNPKESMKRLLKCMIEFCKVTLYKGNIKYFYKLEINNWRSENFKVLLTIASKKEMSRYILNNIWAESIGWKLQTLNEITKYDLSKQREKYCFVDCKTPCWNSQIYLQSQCNPSYYLLLTSWFWNLYRKQRNKKRQTILKNNAFAELTPPDSSLQDVH